MKRRRLSLVAVSAAALWLAGCAAPARLPAAGPHWSGRLALQVESDAADKPPAAFSAGFDLRGSPSQGSLALYTPLGGTAARLEWAPGLARLDAPGQAMREAASLPGLVREATGTDLPVAALFDWLQGRPTIAEGWEADLSGREGGRLRARRIAPPRADLRLVLEEAQP